MNIPAQQKEKLYQYLDGIFTYRESLAEVYDHILSAAENQESGLSFEEKVNSIINEDFGGHKRLPDFEKEYKKAAKVELNSKMRRAFLSNFARSGVFVFVTVLIVLLYYKVDLFASAAVWILLAIYFVLSIGHHFYMQYHSRRIYGSSKKSLRVQTLGNILNLPVGFNPLLILSLKATHDVLSRGSNLITMSMSGLVYLSLLLVLMYVMYPIYLYTYFQLFKKEYTFKPVAK